MQRLRPRDRRLPRFAVDPVPLICVAIVVAIVLGLILVMAFDVQPSRD